MTFLNFLENRRIGKKDSSGVYTHLGMKTPRGKFNIADYENEEFFIMYHNHVFRKKETCNLLEKHINICCILYDLDFKASSPIENHIYSFEFINKFIGCVSKVIRKYLDVPDEMMRAFVMEKSFENGAREKDGLHIMFPYIVTYPSLQYLIREEVLTLSEDLFDEFRDKFSNDLTDVIDECVIERNGWLLYGSHKPGSSPYLLTGIFDCSQKIPTRVSASTFYVNDLELIQVLSIRRFTNADLTSLKDCIYPVLRRWEDEKKKVTLQKARDTYKNQEINCYKYDLHTIESLVDILDLKRCQSYTHWIEVGWCLHTIDYRLLETWINFSKRSENHSESCEKECIAKWQYMRNKGLGVGTLHMWAKQDNPEGYKFVIQNNIEYHICKAALSCKKGCDFSEVIYHIVMSLKKKYGEFFVCSSYSKRNWFEFSGIRWIPDDDDVGLRKKIREELYNDFTNVSIKYHQLSINSSNFENPNIEKYKELSFKICDVAKKLRDAKFRSKLCEEASEQLYWDREKSKHFQNSTFEEVLDVQTKLIGMENGVYDLKLDTFREGRCEDFLTLSTSLSWEEYEWTDPIIDEIRLFLSQILPKEDVREYVLYTLASFLDGEIMYEHFHIWVGSGGNGKSKLIELFEGALGKYCATLSISALTQKRAASSAPQPEIARLKGKRFVVLQEPNENERIQVGIMKELTGGDKIVARSLNKEPIEFKPQFHAILTCNNMPSLPADDGGTWRRIRVVPFESCFKENPDPENKNEYEIDPHLSEKLKKWRTAFFWILTEYYKKMKKNGISEPETVKLSTSEYRMTNDIYNDYINCCFEKVPRGVVYMDSVFSIFQLWYRKNYPDRKCPSRKDVMAYMEKKLGPYKSKRTGKNGWRGYKIHEPVDEQAPPCEEYDLDDEIQEKGT